LVIVFDETALNSRMQHGCRGNVGNGCGALRTCGGSWNNTGRRKLFRRSNGLERDEMWRQRASGGNEDVAYVDRLSKVVASRHVGGVGRHGLIRVSLHRSGSFHLESLRHAV
jgi:hypothetical protein